MMGSTISSGDCCQKLEELLERQAGWQFRNQAVPPLSISLAPTGILNIARNPAPIPRMCSVL